MSSIRSILTVVFVVCACSVATAQGHRGGRIAPHANEKLGKQRGAGPRPVEDFMRMSPHDREKALQDLPADRQEKVRQQLQRYDQMPPEQKAQLQRLWQLSPEKQEKVRNSVRNFGELPQERQQAVRQQLQTMQTMSADERKQFFKTPEFKKQYNHSEQDIMKNMSEILPPED